MISERIRMGAKLELARRDFAYYCHLKAPGFYKKDRAFLYDLCNTFQDFYQSDDEVLIVNMPPRHGKSRTVGCLDEWILGNNQTEKIMTGSYNETLSTVFSKNVRNTIQEEKVDKDKIIYSDIFPNVQIKQGDKDWNGTPMASFIYSQVYTVAEVTQGGKRAYLDPNGVKQLSMLIILLNNRGKFMKNITLGQIATAILLLSTLGGAFFSVYKLIKKFETTNKHLMENYKALLRVTFMMEEMPLSERLKAGHEYIKIGGNGAVKARYELVKEAYKKEHGLKTNKEYLEAIEEMHD